MKEAALSNRDVASLIWLSIALAWALSRREIRESVISILRAFWGRLLAIYLAFAAYVIGVVWSAQSVGLWNTGLVKETVVWLLVSGLFLLFSFQKAAKRGFVGRTVKRAVGLTAFVEFYIGVGSFDLWAEPLLIPVAVFVGLMSAVAGMNPANRIVKRLFDAIASILGLTIVVATAIYVTSNWGNLNQRQLLLTFLLPIWLTVASLPAVYAVSLYSNYEAAFVRLGFHNRADAKARRRAKLALVLGYNFHNHELDGFAGRAISDLADAKTWSDARKVVALQRAESRLSNAKETMEAARAARYAGVSGTDWDGRPFDEREFNETKEALDQLHTFQSAQSDNGRYRTDILSIVSGLLSKTFPEAEINLTFARKDRAWFTWRRTIGGWVLGKGAAGPPPDEWSYLGLEEPRGAPTPTSGWVQGAFPSTTFDPDVD
jgi:hypothetical protein